MQRKKHKMCLSREFDRNVVSSVLHMLNGIVVVTMPGESLLLL